MAAGELRALLAERPRAGVRWGLDRTHAMLERLGDPHRSFRSIHVGGTNGKGMVACTVASVLRRAGARTGLYVSPELTDLRERFQVDGSPLSWEELDAAAREVRPLAEGLGASRFEALTVMAFLAFHRAGVEVAAVEVGLGGRLDATTVLRPDITVLTDVSLDHTDFLGCSLPEVAGEKAGILKSGTPAVMGPLPAPAARVVSRKSREIGAPLEMLGRDAAVEDVRVTPAGTSFRYRSPRRPEPLDLSIPVPGRHQAGNAALALMALDRMGEPPLSAEIVQEGLAGLDWPGRFQVLERTDGTWILDVAHNPGAVSAMLQTLDRIEAPDRRVFLLGILRDKAWKEMLRVVEARAHAMVLTVPPGAPEERRWDLEAVTRWCRDAEGVSDFRRALGRARELAGDGTVVVAGSCYTVGAALRRLSGKWVGGGVPGRIAEPGSRGQGSTIRRERSTVE